MLSVHNEYYFIEAGEDKTKEIKPKRMGSHDDSGYIKAALRSDGKQYTCYAHRIIWTYFNGDIPKDKEINHINGIKDDNRLANLEVIIHSENHKHAHRIQGLRCFPLAEGTSRKRRPSH